MKKIIIIILTFSTIEFFSQGTYDSAYLDSTIGKAVAANEGVIDRETVHLLGRFGVSSEKSPFSAALPKVHRSSTERPGSTYDPVTPHPPVTP